MKKLTKVLSLIIAVTMIFGMTLTSFAAEASDIAAMGFNPNETTNKVALDIVADPLNADESAVKLPAPNGPRNSYGVAGEEGATFILEDKALYTITFDAYYYSDAEGATGTDVTFYKGKENSGLANGNKANLNVSAKIDNANEWQHFEISFFADITDAHKYLLFTTHHTGAANATELLVKNFSIAKVGAYDENGYIELDYDTIPETCYIGEALDLKNMKVTYTDSNGVSTVVTHGYNTEYDNGAEGICELKVTLKDLTTSADIEVITPAISLSDEALSLQLGETAQLVATVDPEAAEIVWKSSDSDVVEVAEDGTLTAKVYGTADITATITVGKIEYSAVCAVEVVAPVLADDDAKVVVDDALVFAGETFTVNAEVKNAEGALTANNIKYNAEIFDLVSYEWVVEGETLAITLTAKEDVKVGKYAVGVEVADETGFVLPVIYATVTVENVAQGDVNLDHAVSAQDAIYVLNYTLFGAEEYPIGQDVDFNASRNITSDDAVYLLYYVLFGAEEYPLPDVNDDGLNVNPGTPVDPDDGFGEWEPIL